MKVEKLKNIQEKARIQFFYLLLKDLMNEIFKNKWKIVCV